MSNADKQTDLETGELNSLFPIRTVSDLTGVNAITLRAWERRYGLINPVRTPSGHRLYSERDIHLINKILGLLDRGISIGQVSRYLEEQPAEQSKARSKTDIWGTYLQRMLSAIIHFDERALENTYNEALSLYPIDVVTDKLLLPLLEDLGRRWVNQEGSIAEEHFFAVYLRNKLGARFHHRAESSAGPKLLLSCLPGEYHEIGLLLFALSAFDRGFDIVMLGANMPLDELPVAARRAKCDAIVLSASIRPAPSILAEKLKALTGQVDIPVFLGGYSSILFRDEISHAGVIPLGTEIGKALQIIKEKVD